MKAVMNPAFLPRDLIEAQFRGFFVGLGRYQRARTIAAQLADTNLPLLQATAKMRGVSKRIQANDLQTVD
jgi:hypothetical protein